MASKKDKLLDSAQRFMLKGQLDKAIKDYQQVVALEPKEIRYRQKLAELLVKDNRKEEAITQYADIGKHYADNSHFLKAIAVYKQIQRLSPGNTEITLLLASLNHKQGLIGNAMAEYGQVVTQLEKERSYAEALKVIEQMLFIDSGQVAIRLKHAELLFASGASENAYQAFRSLINNLRDRGDDAGVRQVSERMAKLFPESGDQNLERISQQIETGELDQGIAALQQWLKRDGRDQQAWQLLCQAQRRKGDQAGLRVSHRQMLELFPDSIAVLKEAVRCELQAGETEKATAVLERHLPHFLERGEPLTAEELLDGAPAAVADQLRGSDWFKRIYEASSGDKKGADVAKPAAAPHAFPSSFDPMAMELELPTEFEPEPESLEPAQPGAAADALLSPWQAEPAASAEQGAPGDEALSLPWEEEISLDLEDDFAADLPAASELELPDAFSVSAPFEEPVTPAPDQTALNDLSFLSETAPVEQTAAPASSPDSSLELTLPDDSEAFPDFDWSEEAEPAAPPQPALELDHFVELDSVGELPEAAGLEPVDHVGEAADLTALEPPNAFGELEPVGHAGEVADLTALEPPNAFGELEPVGHVGEDAGLTEIQAPNAFGELELSDSVGEIRHAGEMDLDELEHVDELEPVEELEHAEELQHPDELVFDSFEQAEEAQGPAVPAEEPPAEAARPLRGWEEIYPDAVSAAASIDPGELYELESHYDLGMGYKEMGMYDGAIRELNLAATNPQRRLACLTLQAICYSEKGEAEKARELLQRGLDLEVLSDEERVTLSYELASLHETTGNLDEAIRIYRQVYSANPGFGDLGNKLFQLTGEEPHDIIELEEADL